MEKAHFGMIGLGTMGRNFLLNVAEHGFSCVGHDLDPAKGELLLAEGEGMPVEFAADIEGFIGRLEAPRNIMMLVPAGPVVDKVIAGVAPLLGDDDLLIDGGNSHYSDTERREAELAAKGIGFMGMGVSGGEEGARRGPSIMPGGRPEHYSRIEALLQAVSAKVNGEPCVAYMGSGSAGHFVKMVHNGIEYAMMQLIAEAYDYMKRVLGMNAQGMSEVFAEWNAGILNSFLVEITSTVLGKSDDETGKPLVELILDTAGQKGTGKWTSQAAMDHGVPVPTIDSAVSMRQISAQRDIRLEIADRLGTAPRLGGLTASTDGMVSVERHMVHPAQLCDALYCGFLAAYAQGMSLLQAASAERSYGLDLAEIARIWRGGCIIRSAMLEDIRGAFAAHPGLPSLFLDEDITRNLTARSDAFRKTAASFVASGIPGMCFSSALAYFDALRTGRLPANLIQAQRDYFGAHTYQRIDKAGTFHRSDWET